MICALARGDEKNLHATIITLGAHYAPVMISAVSYVRPRHERATIFTDYETRIVVFSFFRRTAECENTNFSGSLARARATTAAKRR